MKLLQSSGAQDDEAKGRKKKKENRGLEKLYGKSGTGDRYYVGIRLDFCCRRQQRERTVEGSETKRTSAKSNRRRGSWRGGESC